MQAVEGEITASVEQSAARAKLYQALAEVMAEPPVWLAGPGRLWPLFTAAVETAQVEGNEALLHAAIELAAVPPERVDKRRARYEALFSGTGRPHLHLYESLARDGQLAGPSTFAVWSIYQAAGLRVVGSELPDHVSVELAFLAHLAEQAAGVPSEAKQWHRARRLFIKRHVGQWLIALGEALTRTQDPVYGPIGRLLSAALVSDLSTRRSAQSLVVSGLPLLPQPEKCNLCSFCAQVCPTHALFIDETVESTLLVLMTSACVGCARCVRTCMTGALILDVAERSVGRRILRESPRARCQVCGQPTVSQAELDEVAARIGAPTWLNYCSDCRALMTERVL